MADIITDGRTRVYSVPSIANIAAPTVAELNAGVQLEGLITADGIMGFQPDTAEVDTSALNSTFNTKLPGRASFSGTGLRLKKQGATGDTVYNLLINGFVTNIVIRRDVTSTTAWTVAQACEVYPGVCGEVKNLDPAPNEVHKWEVPFFISPQPNLRAVVA